jgi:hypothetical protein
VWADKLPQDRPKASVVSKVVMLPHLLGDATKSPFHTIVNHCDASAFESKLLELIVQSKWEENIRSQRQWSSALYMMALAVASSAMVSGSTTGGADPNMLVDVVQGAMLCCEAVALAMESVQLMREGCGFYLTGPWNLLDVTASGCLVVGGMCHFTGAATGVQTWGALGVMLKWFGVVDYLRSFPGPASLVRMISVILADIAPFMAILGVVVLGSTFFFAINSPSSDEFGFDDGVVGPFRPLLTVYQLMLGMNGGGELGQSTSWPTVLMSSLFMAFVVVVLLNLLIAIMSDSYEKVKESERVEALRERARIIVEAERAHPSWNKYHKYMHIVEAADASQDRTASVEWEGITGRVKQLLEMQDRRSDSKLEAVENKFGSKLEAVESKLDSKLEALDSKFDSKFEAVDSKLEAIVGYFSKN